MEGRKLDNLINLVSGILKQSDYEIKACRNPQKKEASKRSKFLFNEIVDRLNELKQYRRIYGPLAEASAISNEPLKEVSHE